MTRSLIGPFGHLPGQSKRQPPKSRGKPRVLYIVYWGALEPLGRSLVVPSVLRLAAMGVDLSLITFEKQTDLEQEREVVVLRRQLEEGGVRWRPLSYHKTPKWPATAFDACAAVLAALRLRLRGRFDVVHARTFVAGPMGYVIAKLLGARFVYHNEGFYPDEQVDGGVWRQGSLAHRVALRVEAFLYDHADGLIALSERARDTLKSRPRITAGGTPVVVVPSAVDLEGFRPGTANRDRSRALSLVYLGSVGFRYRLDDAGRFVAAVRRVVPGATLTVVSRAEPSLVAAMLDSSGLAREAWSLLALPHSAVPAELIRHDAGLFFLTEGLSEHGCSPTKIGEYWACGLPVVSTPNVSDTDAIVRTRRVGVVTRGRTPEELEDTARALLGVLQDPGLAARCRESAVITYSLEAACERQRGLYEGLKVR